MKLQQFLRSGRGDLAASYANGQIFPKVLTLPFLYEISGLVTQLLLNGSSKAMAVNASLVSPATFEFQSPLTPAPLFFAIAQINLIIVDAGITIDKFGGIAALTNGVIWRVVDDTGAERMKFGSGLFKTNWDFLHVGGGAIQITSTQDFMNIQWQGRQLGILACMRPGWKVQVIIQDNLSTLTAMECSVTGAYLPNDVQFFFAD